MYHTTCTWGSAHQNDQIPKNDSPPVLCPGGIYSWWHPASSANGSRSHDCAPVTWAYGIPCPAMVSPNASLCKEDKLLYPDYHLIRYVKSGFRRTLFSTGDISPGFQTRVDPLRESFKPVRNGILRFTSGTTPADLLLTSMTLLSTRISWNEIMHMHPTSSLLRKFRFNSRGIRLSIEKLGTLRKLEFHKFSILGSISGEKGNFSWI